VLAIVSVACVASISIGFFPPVREAFFPFAESLTEMLAMQATVSNTNLALPLLS